LNNIKLILGTAQFGLNYGINNTFGKPSQKELFEILDFAFDQKIDSLDTADAYGDSISRIGLYHQQSNNFFKILAKFKCTKAEKLVDQTKKSLDRFHIPYFEVLSYHSFKEYLNEPYLKDALQVLKSEGLIKKIGISIYTNSELFQTLFDNNIDVVQLPFNLLDNQNQRGKYLDNAILNEKEIHARSIFLQGLFFMEEESIPENLISIKPYIAEIKSYCFKQAISIQSLALSYAIYNKNIDRIIIGVETKDQLLKNVNSIEYLENAFDFINQNINVNEPELLNPVNWK
jgi:aryl-alcohol dehydrogenase-like predicted oxidoreductase